jgi:hypothetical protein
LVTKVINNRTVVVPDKVVAPVQTTFIKCRFILDGVIILHEVLHEIIKNKSNVIMFKVDFEKSYDNINWNFPLDVLQTKDFAERYIKWSKELISGGNVVVMVNGLLGSYYYDKERVEAGDPLSPILFDIALDVVQVLIGRAQDSGLLKGVVPDLVEGGLTMIQYADGIGFFFSCKLVRSMLQN